LVGAGAQGFKMATQEGTPYGVHLVTAICFTDAIYKFNLQIAFAHAVHERI
jgi:hypothetical protein